MGAEEEHRSVGVENILCSVAVMDVPIGDQNAPDTVLVLRVARRDRDRVENALEIRWSTIASTAFNAWPVARRAASSDFGEMVVSPVLSS